MIGTINIVTDHLKRKLGSVQRKSDEALYRAYYMREDATLSEGEINFA